MSRQQVKVWDLLVRVFHWALVLSVATAWYTARHFKGVHELAGYVAAALIAIRLVWGIVGSPHARFADFVRGPRTVLAYLGDIARGTERRFLGHNPAGGAMILLLLLSISVQAASGWMLISDQFFGVEWVEVLHKLNFKLLLGLVVLHLMGVALASLRHRENLPLAMLTGRKRAG